MTKPANAVAIFDKLAELYQQKYMDVSLYHDILDVFCKSVETKNPEILEFACGPGNVTKYLLDKRPDFKILGTDLAPNMVTLARENNPNAKFEILDCRDALSLNQKFDAIVCSFCLPYLTKEETIQMITDCHKALNPNGVIYISTMEDNYENSKPVAASTGDVIDMYFYTGDFLDKTLENSGFTVTKLHRQNFPTQDDSIVTDLIVIAKKSE